MISNSYQSITLEEILTVKRCAVACYALMHCGQTPITLLPLISAPTPLSRSPSCRGVHCATKMGPVQKLHAVRKYSRKGDRQIPPLTRWREEWAAPGSTNPVYIHSGWTVNQRLQYTATGPHCQLHPAHTSPRDRTYARHVSAVETPAVDHTGKMRKAAQI